VTATSGHGHEAAATPDAARILANAWTRVLWRCWQDQTPYDPHRHRRLTEFTTDLTKKAT
jgi:hypothetical protein